MAKGTAIEPLAERFKTQTSETHNVLERHPFLVALCKEQLTPVQYFSHLIDLHCVYESLERALAYSQSKEPRLKELSFSGLERATSIKQDMLCPAFSGLYGSPSLQAKNYRKHLETLAKEHPLLLLAHVYTRYLGDLSGGMMLKKHIESQWPQAINFYNFEVLLQECAVESVKAFKDLFKAKLNSLEVTAKEQHDLIEEANVAFSLSGKLFDSIIPDTTP